MTQPTRPGQRPDSQAPSPLDQAAAFYSQGRFHELFQLARQVLAADPRNVEFLDYAAICAAQHDMPAQAELFWKQALTIRPDYAKAHNNLGNLLLGLKRFDEAEACFRRALAIQPDSAAAHNNLGNLFMELERLDESVNSYRQALAVLPDFAQAHYNLGNLLKELQRTEEAAASYAQAHALKPDYVEAHMNESLCRLLIGDFARGWQEYEWRWLDENHASKRRDFEQPLWLGGEALAGKTILLHAEQGLGDTLQFCRYVKAVAALGARVLLEVQPALKSLLASLDGVSQLLAAGETLPRFDLHCPLLSLPLAFGTELSTIPAEVPYLCADPARAVIWASRLGEKNRLRIGLAWSGNAGHKNDRNRSIPLQQLLPLLSPDFQWVCLQKELRPDDRAVLGQHPEILNFAGELHDFADTAALLQSIDLVISVDTAVAHLAGALARPVWLLLPFVPDWRWLLERDDSPWYPSARLFRQMERRGWDAAIERVTNELTLYHRQSEPQRPPADAAADTSMAGPRTYGLGETRA